MTAAPPTIVLGITGSIAAYKTPELVRLFKKSGYRVIPVITESGRKFVTGWTLRSVSGEAPITGQFEKKFLGQPIRHIALTDEAQLIMIAPATANIIAKIAGGIADDFLSTLVLAARCPVLIAPAMNVRMFQNTVTRKNILKLKKEGYFFVGPDRGELACGVRGAGRMAPLEEIFEAAAELLEKKDDFKNKKILITAGPTREYLDPVRYISNASSGKMGLALASAAAGRGAKVILITGPINETPAAEIQLVPVISTAEMSAAVQKKFSGQDIIIMAAAPADFEPVKKRYQKIKKNKSGRLAVQFKKAPDILKILAKKKKTGQLVVGFSLETENLKKNSLRKLREKNLDLVVANQPLAGKSGFETDTNRVLILDRSGQSLQTGILPKKKIAGVILDFIKKYHG